jgi:hypothetical protein
MQDATCAMKICGGINGDFSTITWAPGAARLGNMSAAIWLIPSVHNLRQPRRLVGIAFS